MSAPSAKTRYADWKAPSGDGEILIWPDAPKLVKDTRDNHSRLWAPGDVRFLGVPLGEVRRRARVAAGHIEQDQPLIVTGHQAELWHAGVWIKNAVIDSTARKIGGEALHVCVDTDSPKHLNLRWPDDPPASFPITDDPRRISASWSGQLSPPSASHVARIEAQARSAAADWPFRPLVDQPLARLRNSTETTLPSALCAALNELDASLGLGHRATIASPMLISPPFLLLIASIVADARNFARQYNAALAGYRTDHGMKTTSRPMPDLFVSPTAIEMPLWLDDLKTGQRTRPSAFDRPDGSFALKLVSGEEVAFSPGEDGWAAAERLAEFLQGTSHRLAPRALTLTMFLRLFVADQFVHGIGGGRYDQVLDLLIENRFGIEPPRFAVATATMLFPTAVGRERACLPCVVHEGHQLKHRSLGNRKMAYVDAVNAQPRLSPQRYRAFTTMHDAIEQGWRQSAGEWQKRLEQTRTQEQRDAIEFDRELFYALQPRDRLQMMIERVRASFQTAD
jgi:hypothetical protein